MATATDNSKVKEQSGAVAKMAKNWQLIDDLVGGTPAMRSAGPKYLPKWPQEESDCYQDRLNTAVLFNAFGRTTRTLAGKPFARQMVIKGLSKNVESYLNNIDALGTDVHAFSEQVMRENLRKGLHGVLVEAPDTGGKTLTVAQEKALGLRPYLTQYRANNILGWRSKQDTKNNNSYLTQLRLLEEVTVEDGPFGEAVIQQVRVLYPGRWEIWQEVPRRNGKKEWMKVKSGKTSLNKIPFVFFYGIKEGFGIGAPPLLDLAHLNVQHWQSSSDQDNILHVARVPILFAKGFTTSDKLVIGAKSACSTISPEAELKWVEHTGAAIGAGRQSLLDLEDRMRQIGAEMMVKRPSATTATAVQDDTENNRSDMQNICEQFEDSFEACLELIGEFGKETFKAEVKVHKDFKSAQLGEKAGDYLLGATDNGHISRQTAFEHAQRGDLIAPELTWEQEKARLVEESVLRKMLAEEGAKPKPEN